MYIYSYPVVQFWLIGDKIAGRIRSPSPETQLFDKGGLAGSGMRGGNKNNLSDTSQEVGCFWIAHMGKVCVKDEQSPFQGNRVKRIVTKG